ncbi:Uu.00g072240.m01.CDS01 [Anthostomella pinea]|uniref:Uu.00g072240.m01.CDS01 n=1 Tax=Anthostomella pinea TaxID=933095 RepID=A0AAI8YNQ3_9PEZI|nr:Uu.00g072240.m01.CDS01 [Anthostomella pinea]
MATTSETWDWPADMPEDPAPDPEPSTATASGNDQTHPSEPPQQEARPEEDPKKYVRMCWICRDEVEPTWEEPGMIGSMRNRRRRRHYISEDGDRLCNPCRCKGSVKYVHEGCLKLWMNENPNAYKCSRCHYEYRMDRLTWAQRLRSPLLSLGITMLILVATVFLLGFVADPILGLWLDPVGTITDKVSGSGKDIDNSFYDEDDGWFEHLLKGVFSLGLLGFAKAFLAMSPWQWWNLRTTGIVGGGTGRRGGTGRDRMENINLTLVLIGVLTFLYTVWKGTRKWTERTLDRASQRILNVQEDTGDDSDDEDGGVNDDDANGNEDTNH